jgi:hypothetical protein
MVADPLPGAPPGGGFGVAAGSLDGEIGGFGR